MKYVVSISLGASQRNHRAEVELLGKKAVVERLGTDGDFDRARRLLQKYDGQADAIGLGGIDLYIYAGNHRYTIRDAYRLKKEVKKTPVVDGSGLKNTLERLTVDYLLEEGIDLTQKKILMVCGVDRFGMAQSLHEKGCDVTYGDLLFGVGLPIPINSLKTLNRIACILAPLVSRLPFSLLYPTGSRQNNSSGSQRRTRYFRRADVIAGDFHYIRRYLPPDLEGNKIILTNTVTNSDLDYLRKRGIRTLITTTPEFDGRSFGTNLLEALLVALSEHKNGELSAEEYNRLLETIDFRPRILNLTQVQNERRMQEEVLKEV